MLRKVEKKVWQQKDLLLQKGSGTKNRSRKTLENKYIKKKKFKIENNKK